MQKHNRETIAAKRIVKLRKKRDDKEMLELAKRFMGKECIIYTFANSQITGTITEISTNAILIENKGTVEAVNLDYILRIREFPLNKKGKKKSIILD